MMLFFWRKIPKSIVDLCITPQDINISSYTSQRWYEPSIWVILRYCVSIYHHQIYIRVCKVWVCKEILYIVQWCSTHTTHTTHNIFEWRTHNKHIKTHPLKQRFETVKRENNRKLDHKWYCIYYVFYISSTFEVQVRYLR